MATSFMTTMLVDLTNNYLTHGMITVCAVCFIILIANVMRRKIKFLRRSYMPTAVIAGFLGLVVKEVIFAITKATNGEGFNIFSELTLQGLVFHGLSIGFIALCLRDKDDYAKEFDKPSAKKERVSAFKSGSVIVSTYLFQGLIGIGITVLLALTFIPELNEGTGIMLALGFGQGPGQASSIGSSWDKLNIFAPFGDSNPALNYGITIAALGFVWASIPGVILINRVAKKKGILINKNEFEKSGETKNQEIEGPDEVPLSESIDKFSLQVCMVGAVYLVTLGLLVGIEALLRLSGVEFLANLVPTIWGFSFMIAVAVALLAKTVMRRLFRSGIMHRKYPNSYMMNRISGVAFDISTTSALCLISVTSLGILWVPVLIITTVGGIACIFYIRFLCNRVYPNYKDEAFLSMYGMLTGTISNGMILVREIDSTFKTPAADNLVVGSSTGIILGFPLFVLIPMAVGNGGSNIWWVSLIIAAYLFGLLGYMLGWYKKIFKRKKPIEAAALEQDNITVDKGTDSES